MPPLLLKLLFTLMPNAVAGLAASRWYARFLIRRDDAGQPTSSRAYGGSGKAACKNEWFAGMRVHRADIK